MKRLLPSGPLTEQPMPARGREEVVVGSPGRNSALDIMPSEIEYFATTFILKHSNYLKWANNSISSSQSSSSSTIFDVLKAQF